MSQISTLILEELVFEKVCVGARLADLILFEEDLDRSIHRALEDCGDNEDARDQAFARHLETAWKRWIKNEGDDPERDVTAVAVNSSASLTTACDSNWIFGDCPSKWACSSNASSD